MREVTFLVAALAIACGGGDFEAAVAGGGAGMGAAGSSGDFAGSGGMAGSSGANAQPYDGPPWIDCSDGGDIVARGIAGTISGLRLAATVVREGDKKVLWHAAVNGVPLNTGTKPAVSNRSDATANITWDLDSTGSETSEVVPAGASLSASDIFSAGLDWCTGEIDGCSAMQMVSCSLSRSDELVAEWASR